jgi:thiol-disulfide isomerase/thioredoxin
MIRPKIGESVIVALIILNIFELSLFFTLRSRSRLYDSQVRFPVPSGYLVDGKYMSGSRAPCSLLRLSAEGCPYCRADQPLYQQLVRQARRSGCTTIVLGPKIGQIKPSNDQPAASDLQFVTMDFGSALNPVMTPETILVDNRDGRIRWDREGELDTQAVSSGLAALRRFANVPPLY